MPAPLAVSMIALAVAAGFAVGWVAGQGRPQMRTNTVLELTTDQLPRRARVRANVNHWDPGSETGDHTHAGPVVFVVLEGKLEEISSDGRRRALEAGQVFWKPPHASHNVRNPTDRPARALAVHLDPAP